MGLGHIYNKKNSKQTFEEFKEEAKKRAYLCPTINAILNDQKTHPTIKLASGEEKINLGESNLKKVWARYRLTPVVECILNFKNYFVQTYNAFENYCNNNDYIMKTPMHGIFFDEVSKKNKKEYIAWVVSNRTYNYLNKLTWGHWSIEHKDEIKKLEDVLLNKINNDGLSDDEFLKKATNHAISIINSKDSYRSVYRRKKRIEVEKQNTINYFITALNFEMSNYPITKKMQPYVNVTKNLKKSSEDCKIFATAIKKGNEIYAFKGPIIHKWKNDKKGCLMRNTDGKSDFMMEFNDDVIFWSTLCSPYLNEHLEQVDMRFIAYTEISDIVNYYKKYDKKKYGDIKKGSRTVFGIHLEELLSIKKFMKPKPKETVYLMTGERYEMSETLFLFSKIYNNVKKAHAKGIPAICGLSPNDPNLPFSTWNLSKQMLNYFDNKNFEILEKRVLKWITFNTHDKIPHSLIGALVKSGETEIIMKYLCFDLTKKLDCYESIAKLLDCYEPIAKFLHTALMQLKEREEEGLRRSEKATRDNNL